MTFDEQVERLGGEPKMLYTVAEIARTVGVSEHAVRAAAKSGALKTRRAGYLMARGEWIDEWLEGSE